PRIQSTSSENCSFFWTFEPIEEHLSKLSRIVHRDNRANSPFIDLAGQLACRVDSCQDREPFGKVGRGFARVGIVDHTRNERHKTESRLTHQPPSSRRWPVRAELNAMTTLDRSGRHTLHQLAFYRAFPHEDDSDLIQPRIVIK